MSGSDDDSMPSGDSQLVSSSSFPSSNNFSSSYCNCTNPVYHLLSCSVPLSRRVSLYFTSPSTLLPRETYTFNVEHVMAQRLSMLADASDAQKQLINVGNSVSRANCSLKQHVWTTLLVGYVPSDSCYPAEVLVAGMKYGSLVRYEGDRTESVAKQNHPDARKHPRELLQLVLQELQLGRVIGPFSLHSPPFECVKICPLNIVPKGEKKWRLIQDLSSCNKAAALRLYRRRLRLRHDTSQMYHNNTQQQ